MAIAARVAVQTQVSSNPTESFTIPRFDRCDDVTREAEKNRAPSRHWASEIFQRTLDRDTLDKPDRLNRREELFIVLFQWNSISTTHVVRDFSSKRRADSNRLLDCPWAPSHYVLSLSFGECCFYLSRKINFFKKGQRERERKKETDSGARETLFYIFGWERERP